MSKRQNMQRDRRALRKAMNAAGDAAPVKLGHGKQTTWKKHVTKDAFSLRYGLSLQAIDGDA